MLENMQPLLFGLIWTSVELDRQWAVSYKMNKVPYLAAMSLFLLLTVRVVPIRLVVD